MAAPSKFIVLTSQRTGSTWLVDLLDSHPEITAYSELFLGGGVGRPTWGGAKDVPFWETYRDRAAPRLMERDLLRSYLDQVFTPLPGVRAIGFKVMYEQMGNAGLGSVVASERFRIVHLVRNPLDVMISRAVAERSHVYHRRTQDSSVPVTVSLDPEQLLEQLASYQREVVAARARWAFSPCPFFETRYEVLLGGARALAPLLEFLGVEPEVTLSSDLVRVNTASRRDRIENWDEVVHALAGTAYGLLLEQ